MQGEPVRGGFPDPGFGSLPGLERARAYVRGLIPQPPLSHLIGLRVTQAGPGSATAIMPASPWLLDPNETIQPVVLMEGALHLAALTAAPPGSDVSTTTLSVSYLRPANVACEMFLARARVVHSGRTYTLAETVVEDAGGRAVAQGSATLITRPLDPPPPPLTSPLEPISEPVYPIPDPYLRPLPQAVGVDLESGDDLLAVFSQMMAGELRPTPAFQLFGARVVDVDRGRLSFVLRASDWLCWQSRVVAPGALAYVALIAMHGAAGTAV